MRAAVARGARAPAFAVCPAFAGARFADVVFADETFLVDTAFFAVVFFRAEAFLVPAPFFEAFFFEAFLLAAFFPALPDFFFPVDFFAVFFFAVVPDLDGGFATDFAGPRARTRAFAFFAFAFATLTPPRLSVCVSSRSGALGPRTSSGRDHVDTIDRAVASASRAFRRPRRVSASPSRSDG